MTTVAPAGLVQGAVRAPLPFGLFSTFTFRTGDRWESGVTWETINCDPALGYGQPVCDPGTAEVQSVTVAGSPKPTGGTFTLSLSGSTTAALPYNATATAVQTELRKITNLALSVSGGPAPNTALVITFGGSGNPPQMTGSAAGLTGGTGTAITVATTTSGVDPNAALGLPRDLSRNVGDYGVASPFTVYAHFTCSPVGFSLDSAQTQARAALLATEQARVEQAFWTGDLGNVPNLATGATIIAGSTAVPPAAALAMLEDYIAANYQSLGVIHLSRGAALQASAGGLLTTTGGRLTTIVGTPVAAGGGYPGSSPSGVAAGNGTAWAYASPTVFGYRSDVYTADSRPGDLFDRGHNELTAIAERSYLLGYDPCGVGAVNVKLL